MKICVLSKDLKFSKVSLDLIAIGKLFHSLGPQTGNAWVAKALFLT